MDIFKQVVEMKLYSFRIKDRTVVLFRGLFFACLLILSQFTFSQQDPGYTEYMYNTMNVNPGYTGSRGNLIITALSRAQWVGIDGAPRTYSLSIDTPLGYKNIGLGMNIVSDKLGPSNELYINGNISYSVMVGQTGNLSLGLKLGGRSLNVDWNKGDFKQDKDEGFKENISSIFPVLGAGLYYYSDSFYLGFSVPTFIQSKHYSNRNLKSNLSSSERLHYFFMGGYLLNLTGSILFKPAFMVRAVSGAPTSVDLSANFLFNKRFTFGVSCRIGDSISGLLGFNVTEGLKIGYAYDLTTTDIGDYNSGTHEVMLRYEFLKGDGNQKRSMAPRFF